MRDKYKVGILLLIATVLFVSYNVIVRNQVSEALSRYGSRGSEEHFLDMVLVGQRLAKYKPN